MRKLFILIALLTLTNLGFSQTTKDKLCGKKWYPEKYKEVDGKIYPLEDEIKLLYTLFNCDGTFESLEDIDIMVRGTWSFEEKTNSVILVTKESRIPMDNKVTIVSCDGNTLEFIKFDGGGDKLTIYSIAK